MCNGLTVPIVAFDTIYSFDVDTLVQEMPGPEGVSEERLREITERCLRMTVNNGARDDYRALNYLVLRYPQIYATIAECQERNLSLIGVEVRPSHLSDTRRIVEVIFSFGNRQTDFPEKYFVRVDVTEEFPFLVTGMTRSYNY